MKSDLLSVAQAAKLKGVSRASIYSAIARGRLSHQRILGHLAVRESDVRAWTPVGHRSGRPKGSTTSAEGRARMSAGQKQRWARLREETPQQSDAD